MHLPRLLLWLVLAGAGLPSAAHAAEYAVTSTADGVGSCAPGSATCTIRQAIIDAKGTPGRDTVRVPAGTYELTGQDLIIAIGEQIDLVGDDPRTTILREVAGGDGRVFLVEQDASLHLQGVTLTGTTTASAILLFSGGNDLLLRDVIVTGNTATRGAAIDATSGASVVVESSTLHGNTASERGGAIRVTGAGTAVTVRRSTITGNTAPLGSGIALQAGTVTLDQATLAGGLGGGADLDTTAGATASARGSVLGGCAGVGVTSQGANLDAGAGCALTGPGDRSALDPLLGPLGDQGGRTPTRLPQPGSPLLDADPGCTAGVPDQRGVGRPQGPACDIGAVEVEVAPPPPAAPDPSVGVAPRPFITRLALDPARFSARAGTRVVVRVTSDAVLRLRVERARTGRRSGGRCVAARSRRVPRARRCTRWVLLPGAVQRTVAAGTSRVRFTARVGGRTLRPGRHRLVARVRATSSPSFGAAVRRAFTVR